MKCNREFEWQDDADRLKALFQQHYNGLTQAAFGKKFKLGSQGMVWQYLNAKTPLNYAAATKFAIGLGIAVEEFSPRLAKEAADQSQGSGRVPVSLQLQPMIRGKMIQIAGERSGSGGKTVHLYKVYEEALLEFIRKNGHKI